MRKKMDGQAKENIQAILGMTIVMGTLVGLGCAYGKYVGYKTAKKAFSIKEARFAPIIIGPKGCGTVNIEFMDHDGDFCVTNRLKLDGPGPYFSFLSGLMEAGVEAFDLKRLDVWATPDDSDYTFKK